MPYVILVDLNDVWPEWRPRVFPRHREAVVALASGRGELFGSGRSTHRL